MLDCIENSISKNRGFLTKELIKLDEYRSILKQWGLSEGGYPGNGRVGHSIISGPGWGS